VGANFRRLALANISAQGIPLAVSPVLSRLYDPVAFGSFGKIGRASCRERVLEAV
jgi:hypothetical protein